ncbi:T9SS type A sorting domain-containing protein [candidate division KSB1 bacterium]|nr:T9SS type A sorting domain-containing protein [candidate division KSB1 bacterium]
MTKKLLLLLMVLLMMGNLLAQDDMYLMWSDYFDDDDPPALKNVGWLYYGESDALVGQIIEQRDGELFIEQGSYGGLVGVGLVESNGVPAVFPDNEDTTKQLLLKNDYSNPNQVISFKVRFARWRNLGPYTSFFLVSTRLEMTDSTESVPDADPTVQPGYALILLPLEKAFRVGKYQGELAVLNPAGDGWKFFGQGAYLFEMEVNYLVKFYLKDADFKVKIWEGTKDDEPEAWLWEGTDTEARVSGNYTVFGAVGAPPSAKDGDQFFLDDIEFWGWKTTDVAEENHIGKTNSFQLAQNYPNPFNPTTNISFALAEKGQTQLSIFNLAGQQIRTLVNAELPAGSHSVAWDGKDANYQAVPSGIYFYKIVTNNMSETRRMVLIK